MRPAITAPRLIRAPLQVSQRLLMLPNAFSANATGKGPMSFSQRSLLPGRDRPGTAGVSGTCRPRFTPLSTEDLAEILATNITPSEEVQVAFGTCR